MNKSFFLISVLLALAASKPLNFNKVIWATDCGSNEPYRSAVGFRFQQDVGFSPNTKVSDYNNNDEIAALTIKYTTDSNIYKTERHADESFHYKVPVESSGKYVLITKFAEMWFRESGKRAFDIKFGDCVVAEKLDVFSKVGKFAAYDEYTEFEMKVDQIFYKDKLCSGALKGNKLIVQFEKINIDNPMVNAIVLYQGGLEDTDFYDMPQMRADWDKREAEEKIRLQEEKERKAEAALKRNEKHRRRNDELDEDDEVFEDFDYDSVPKNSISDMLFSSSLPLFLGMVVILVLVVKVVGQKLETGSEGPSVQEVKFEGDDNKESSKARDIKKSASKKNK